LKDLAKNKTSEVSSRRKHLEENQEEVHEGLRRKQTLEASSRCQALRRKVRRSSRRPTSLLFSKSVSLSFLLL